jgi:hypothetical protein
VRREPRAHSGPVLGVSSRCSRRVPAVFSACSRRVPAEGIGGGAAREGAAP